MSDADKPTELYRIPAQGKIAGVCAGLAERYGIEVWLVRIGVVSAFFLGIPFIPVLYIAAWLLLDKKPIAKQTTNSGLDHTISVKSKIWQQGQPPREAFKELKTQFRQLELRLRNIETYVTSSEFNLSREIDSL